MRFTDIGRMCIENLKRRKGRTILTVLGVFIGCTSIVVMVSIGIGMSESNDRMLAEMGDLSIIEVSQGYAEGSSGNNSEAAKLDDTAVDTFRTIGGVAAVMPKLSMDQYNVRMVAGINERYYCDWAQVIGLDTEAMEAMGYQLVDGKIPGVGKDEAIAGQYFAYSFYDSLMPEGRNYIDRWSGSSFDEYGNPLDPPDPYFNIINTPVTLEIDKGDETEIKYRREIKFTGIAKEDYGKGWETSDGVIMGIDAMKDLIASVEGNASKANSLTYSTILVKAEDI